MKTTIEIYWHTEKALWCSLVRGEEYLLDEYDMPECPDEVHFEEATAAVACGLGFEEPADGWGGAVAVDIPHSHSIYDWGKEDDEPMPDDPSPCLAGPEKRLAELEMFLLDMRAFLAFALNGSMFSDKAIISTITHDIAGLVDRRVAFLPKVNGYHRQQEARENADNE